MYRYFGIKHENINGCYEFLNLNFVDLMKGKTKNHYTEYVQLKSLILDMLVTIEHTMRGTFSTDLLLRFCDVDMFKQMYPTLCSKEVLDVTDSVETIGRILEDLRNLCAHIIYRDRKFRLYSFDFSFLKNAVKFDPKLIYYDEEPTVAGMLYFLCLFLRQEEIKKYTSEEYSLGLITCGHVRIDNSSKFVDEVSKVNLELPIRKKEGETIISSIVGEYDIYSVITNNHVITRIGFEKQKLFYSNLKFNGETLTISRGSLTRVYYANEYNLVIKNKDKFIEYSNLLPPYTFIDYLYKAKINVFDDNAIEFVETNFNLIMKLNYPKFYTNKNVDILLYGELNCDFRHTNEVFSKAIKDFYLLLEGNIISFFHMSSHDYKSTREYLNKLKIDSDTVHKLVLLRNFAFHGYIAEEAIYIPNDDKIYIYSLKEAILLIKTLMDDILNIDYKMYDKLNKFLNFNMIDVMVKSIFANIVKQSSKYIFKDGAVPNLSKMNLYIEHCGFDLNNLLPIYDSYLNPNSGILEVKLSDFELSVYCYYNQVNKLRNVLNNKGYKEINFVEKGLYKYIEFSK